MVVIKALAKSNLIEAAKREKAEIKFDENPALTDAVRKNELTEVDKVLNEELAKIEQATTNDDVNKFAKEGVKKIEDIHKPLSSNAHEAAVLALPELDYQTSLVSGTAIVNKGEELTDDHIKKQLVLSDEMKVLEITKPSTDASGNFEAIVKIQLADKSVISVKVPVSVSDTNPQNVDDLAQAKEAALELVEKAKNDKIAEIRKQEGLSDQERNDAIKAVEKARNDAWNSISETSSSGTALALGEKIAENIKAFSPKPGQDSDIVLADVSELDEAKAKAIAEVLQAELEKTNLTNKDSMLTESERQAINKEVQRIKAKAINDIKISKDKKQVEAIAQKAVEDIMNVRPKWLWSYNYTDDTLDSNKQVFTYWRSTSGEDLKKVEKGILEPAIIDGYDLLKTSHLEDGSIVHIYKKKESNTTKPQPNQKDNKVIKNKYNRKDNNDPSNTSTKLPKTGSQASKVLVSAELASILTGLGMYVASHKRKKERQ